METLEITEDNQKKKKKRKKNSGGDSSIFAICNDKLYIFSSASFHAGACFYVTWISSSLWFLVGLFSAMPCKTASKNNNKT